MTEVEGESVLGTSSTGHGLRGITTCRMQRRNPVPCDQLIRLASWSARSDTIRRGDLMSTKSWIYKLLRLWNDASAVRKGKGGKRIGRRIAGKTSGRLLRKRSCGGKVGPLEVLRADGGVW